jgi:hypothetical protein
MELADEFGHPDQAGLGRYIRHAGFLPGHVAFHEAQDLPPLLVQAQEPGRTFQLTFSSGLAWTVLIVEGAGVVMLLLTAALLWQRR